MGGINEATSVARGISEQGFLVMTAAFFLVLSAMMMVACFKWFKSIITKSMEDYGESLKELIEKTNDQNNMLSDISEGLRQETLLRLKVVISNAIDLSVEQVCRIIKDVREENNIDKKEQTKKKIHARVWNVQDERANGFNYFTYHGKKLSEFTNPKWSEWVADVVESEVYSDKVNNGRAYANVKQVYERIKHDFFNRLENGNDESNL
jgi:hypothetical protein